MAISLVGPAAKARDATMRADTHTRRGHAVRSTKKPRHDRHTGTAMCAASSPPEGTATRRARAHLPRAAAVLLLLRRNRMRTTLPSAAPDSAAERDPAPSESRSASGDGDALFVLAKTTRKIDAFSLEAALAQGGASNDDEPTTALSREETERLVHIAFDEDAQLLDLDLDWEELLVRRLAEAV